MLAVLFLAVFDLSAASFHKVELSEEKTPYDYIRTRLDAIKTDLHTGLPISSSYEVEESEDYPERIEGAASSLLNTVTNIGGTGGVNGIGGIGAVDGIGGIGSVGGIDLNQRLGYGGIGLRSLGLGQGLGFGLGGVGGVGGVGGLGVGANGVGLGNGVGLVNPALVGSLGVGGIGIGGLNNGFGGGFNTGLGGGLLYHPILGQIGGGYVDKNAYDAAQKKGAGENVEKIEKKVEEESKHGQEGFQQAAAAAKDEKGESSFYKDEEAKKKAAGDEKFYEGGQKFDKHGANEEQLKKAKSHKKGHVSKGFKSSSSKNEEEKTESFYDEAHDEADHKVTGQNIGSFGENAQQGFKGAHEEKVLDANAQGKEGHHVSEHKIDDAKGNKGEFLQKGYKGGAEQLEKFNNLGAQSVHGHQEASGGYQQNKGILPIHR